MTEIQKTRDYSIFTKIQGNRKLVRSHVKKMIEAIQKDNQLCMHPIIINKDFSVIDGQHRLEAAKTLGLEIYYIQSQTIGDLHVIEGNVNQKGFEVDDYINYFAVRERNPVYLQLIDMLTRTGLKPKALLTLVLGTVSTNILTFLKTGKFRFPENENIEKLLTFYREFIDYASDKRIRPPSMFTNHNFTRALRWLFNTNGFDSMMLFKKLDLRWFDLKPQRTSQEWYELLLNIYNFKNQNRIEANADI